MPLTATILSIVLAAVFLATGTGKLTGFKPMAESGERIGVTPKLARPIGVLELSAAAGLLVGIGWHPLGVAAAVGLVLLMIGGAAWHTKAKEPLQGIPALVLAVLATLVAYGRI